MLLDDIVADSRWDMTYLGMQIMVEGLALAAFGFLHQMTTEPLLKQLLRYVMSDEARHVAFGVLSLQEYYAGLGAAEIRERQEFAFEAAVRMRDRFLQQETWERMGVDVKEAVKAMQNAPDRPIFQGLLFSKIVPNCKKLGLLDAGDGWLRDRFTELGVIQFEDWVDTGEEYGELDQVAKDREAARRPLSEHLEVDRHRRTRTLRCSEGRAASARVGSLREDAGVDGDVDGAARRDHHVVGAHLAADEELAALATVEPGADLERLVDRDRREVAHGQLAGERRLLDLGDHEAGDVVERGRDDAAVRATRVRPRTRDRSTTAAMISSRAS